MSDRNRGGDKRRAIEGLLGSKKAEAEKQAEQSAGPADASGEEKKLDEDLAYVPVSLDEESEETPPSLETSPEAGTTGNAGDSQRGIIIAAKILAIGLVTSLLIIVREDIVSLFNPAKDENALLVDQRQRIEELEEELAALRKSGENERTGFLSIQNLRAANDNLDAALTAERAKNESLQEQVDSLREELANREQSDSQDSQRVAELERQLEEAEETLSGKDSTIASLSRGQDDQRQTLVSLTRENSRLNRELEDAKEEIDELQSLRRENSRLKNERDSLSSRLSQANSQLNIARSTADETKTKSEQLDEVNREYMRVLDLLKESREANNDKQTKIEQLMRENTDLRSRVNTLERYAGNNSSGNSTSSPGLTAAASRQQEYLAPELTYMVRPRYPETALRRGIEGTVMLRLRISGSGEVLSAEVTSSPDPSRALDRAAIDAAKKWRFEPARRNGRPVEAWHRVPLEFTINRE